MLNGEENNPKSDLKKKSFTFFLTILIYSKANILINPNYNGSCHPLLFLLNVKVLPGVFHKIPENNGLYIS